MPISKALADFRMDLTQCDNLISNSHQTGPSGTPILSQADREQITVAAFLNMFIAWEGFIETTMTNLMVGTPTITGRSPSRFVIPPTVPHAKRMLIGTVKYFDFANHDNLRKIVNVYFDGGYPFEPHISSIFTDLSDLRTMRNASAHISSTTQTALEALARRVFGQPRPGVTLYQLLTLPDPRSTMNETVFLVFKNKLLVAAELIANG